MARQPIFAVSGIGLKFNRTSTYVSSVSITVVDENGTAIEGASETKTLTQAVTCIRYRTLHVQQ